ncbi:MAG TPA: redoxin domain-containing protein, partial [Phycisphaerales bacterium]|nr:redoxin domain-containing protein [Phycisphaerales bacterium]
LPAATAALDAETRWLGEPLTAPARKDKPLVLAFIAPGPGIKDAKALSALADKWAMSSVNVIGVCDASAKWDTFTKVAASNKLTFAAMHDKLSDDAAKENETPEGKLAPKRGNLADALGVKTFPTYIVIDAEGKVRAAGVKADKLDAVIDAVLSASPTRSSKTK